MSKVSDEFLFIRDRIEKIVMLIGRDESSSFTEACFILGCLHELCLENSIKFKEEYFNEP